MDIFSFIFARITALYPKHKERIDFILNPTYFDFFGRYF